MKMKMKRFALKSAALALCAFACGATYAAATEQSICYDGCNADYGSCTSGGGSWCGFKRVMCGMGC